MLCLNRNMEEQDKCFVSLVCRERVNDNDVVGLEEVRSGQTLRNGVKCWDENNSTYATVYNIGIICKVVDC